MQATIFATAINLSLCNMHVYNNTKDIIATNNISTPYNAVLSSSFPYANSNNIIAIAKIDKLNTFKSVINVGPSIFKKPIPIPIKYNVTTIPRIIFENTFLYIFFFSSFGFLAVSICSSICFSSIFFLSFSF